VSEGFFYVVVFGVFVVVDIFVLGGFGVFW